MLDAASHHQRKLVPVLLLLPSLNRPTHQLPRRWRAAHRRVRMAAHRCPRLRLLAEHPAAMRVKMKKNEPDDSHARRWAALHKLRSVPNSRREWRLAPLANHRLPNRRPVLRRLAVSWLAPNQQVVLLRLAVRLDQARVWRLLVEAVSWPVPLLSDVPNRPMDSRDRPSLAVVRVRLAKPLRRVALPRTSPQRLRRSLVRLTPAVRHRARPSIPLVLKQLS